MHTTIYAKVWGMGKADEEGISSSAFLLVGVVLGSAGKLRGSVELPCALVELLPAGTLSLWESLVQVDREC